MLSQTFAFIFKYLHLSVICKFHLSYWSFEFCAIEILKTFLTTNLVWLWFRFNSLVCEPGIRRCLQCCKCRPLTTPRAKRNQCFNFPLLSFPVTPIFLSFFVIHSRLVITMKLCFVQNRPPPPYQVNI